MIKELTMQKRFWVVCVASCMCLLIQGCTSITPSEAAMGVVRHANDHKPFEAGGVQSDSIRGEDVVWGVVDAHINKALNDAINK